MDLEWKEKEGHLFADGKDKQYWIITGHFSCLKAFVVHKWGVQVIHIGTFPDIEAAKAKAMRDTK